MGVFTYERISSVKTTHVMNSFDKSKPNIDLPLFPPKVDIETREILAKTITALAQLNGAIS